MQIAIEKIGERDGKERFVLVNVTTGEKVTARDVSEPTMRRFLDERGMPGPLIDECLAKARKRYEKAQSAPAADDEDFDVFLQEIGLEDELTE